MQVLVGEQASTGAGGAGSSMQQQQRQAGQKLHAAVDLEDEHVFLYKLVPGVVAASYGVSTRAYCSEQLLWLALDITASRVVMLSHI